MNVLAILINFIGAVAVLLFGMKLMSEGLQKFAGNKMRSIISKVTSNPLRGIFTGAAVTCAIQSSSATTVMVVSFVNAGMLTLAGAVALIMGANIGTTMTAWIITLFGLGEGSGAFSLPMTLATVALLFIFSKKDRLKSVGEAIIGLALLLFSMSLLKQAMPAPTPELLESMSHLSNYGFASVLIFVAIGALLTCLIQSSDAVMATTLVMSYNGWIGFDVAVGLVMGLNIGTTITANLAAIVANANAKRAARAHLVFNVIGVLMMLALFRPMTHLIDIIITNTVGSSPYTAINAEGYTQEAIPGALSLFHTFFNVGNTLIQAWFVPLILKAVYLMVPVKPEESEEVFSLRYIPSNYINLAEMNIQSAKLEIETFSNRIIRMFDFLPDLRTAKDEKEFGNIIERIEKYEAITDRMEQEIATYLTHVSTGDHSAESSQRISSMLRIVDNLESIGDSIYQIAMTRKNKRTDAIHFSQDLNDNLEQMTLLVKHALQVMDSNLHNDYNKVTMEEAYKAEDAVNAYRDQLRTQHLNALKNGTYDYAIGTAYSGLYALYEKLADYVININEAITGEKRHA